MLRLAAADDDSILWNLLVQLISFQLADVLPALAAITLIFDLSVGSMPGTGQTSPTKTRRCGHLTRQGCGRMRHPYRQDFVAQ
jgi:hypothetical protein